MFIANNNIEGIPRLKARNDKNKKEKKIMERIKKTEIQILTVNYYLL